MPRKAKKKAATTSNAGTATLVAPKKKAVKKKAVKKRGPNRKRRKYAKRKNTPEARARVRNTPSQISLAFICKHCKSPQHDTDLFQGIRLCTNCHKPNMVETPKAIEDMAMEERKHDHGCSGSFCQQCDEKSSKWWHFFLDRVIKRYSRALH